MTTETAIQPILVIAPNWPQFRRWCIENDVCSRDARFVSHEETLRGVWDREVVVVESARCNRELLAMARYRKATGAITLRWESI